MHAAEIARAHNRIRHLRNPEGCLGPECPGSGLDRSEFGRARSGMGVARRMRFEGPDGAVGTSIFWKHVGHSICLPLSAAVAETCCPQTGHANLNSIIGREINIPQPA